MFKFHSTFFVNLIASENPMRIAIISDIHEDIVMLERAMAILKSVGYDMLVCLGDITGFAPEYYSHTPNANACIDILKEHAHIVLAGNHDLYSAQRLPSYHLEKNIPHNWYELTIEKRYELSNNTLWLYEEEVEPELTPENEKYLHNLHEWFVFDADGKKILFSHFLQPDLSGIGRWFPYRVGELRPHFRFMEELGVTLGFVGHCHPEGTTLLSKLFWPGPAIGNLKVGYKPRIVLCPAIVSGGKPSGCIVYNAKTNEISSYSLNQYNRRN